MEASGGDISKKMKGFRWHPEARLHGAAGAGEVLRAALAVEGQAFRIGGSGPQPVERWHFETLTSGSSGVPRRILRSMESWIAGFAVNARLFGIGPGKGSGPGTAVAVLGDLQQSLALYGALEALHLGASLWLLGGMRPDRQRQALEGVDLLYATPAQLRLLCEADGPVLARLRFVLVGGSKLDAPLRARIAQLAPAAQTHEFYGAAEASFITLAQPGDPEDAVGQAYPGVQIAIRDAAGYVQGEGELGEIWVESPYLFRRYAGDEDGALKTGARWRDGWLSVGEIGRIEAGLLYLAGRAGRMVTVADQNVFPEEIEGFMAGLPGVDRVAVLPLADGLRGVVLVAVVQGDSRCEAELLATLRRRYGPLKAPRAIRWRSDWPALGSGKTDLAALAQGLAPWR